MAGKLIIIEAGDGCGKATQAAKLYERLLAEKRNVRKVEFPNYQSQSSALVKMYLNGEFGSEPGAVNPFAASAFYAVDRFASYKQDWGAFYHNGGIIIADRYTTSNMVHQAVKIADQDQRAEYLNWLWDIEFVKFGLPIPDKVIFLDMPPEYSRQLMKDRINKAGEGRIDIHEKNQAYLANCHRSYQDMASRYNWNTVGCVADGRLKTVEEIHDDVYEHVAAILD